MYISGKNVVKETLDSNKNIIKAYINKKSKEKDINYIEEHFEELEKEFNRVKEIVTNYNNK